MSKKKWLALLLVAAMVLSLAACGKNGSTPGSTDGTKQTGTDGKGDGSGSGDADKGNDADGGTAADGEVYEVVMEIPTLGAEPSGLAEVEAAVNAIVEPAIGVKVTMYPISISDLASQSNLMITSGDKLDLMCVFASGVGDYVAKDAVLELDELFEQYGQDIERAEGAAIAGGYFAGHLYAIPSEEKQARQYGFMARKDMVEELGFSFDADSIYTLDELEELFAAYKAKYGEGYYCLSGTASTTEYYGSIHAVDNLGSVLSTGTLPGAGLDGETTVTNIYETDAYKEYAERMYRWAQAGYYSPDASTNTDAGTIQVQSGYYLGGFQGTETDMPANFSRDCGYEMIPINLVEPYSATHMYQTSLWAIPSTCENPEKTFQFLNMLYADNELANILTNGLEGVSYETVAQGERPGQKVIRYADGVDAASCPYIMPLHVYGDKLNVAVFEPMTLDYFQMATEFNENIPDSRRSITLGYVFDSSSVSTQRAAVNAVVQQYSGIIATGAQDPAVILPEFNKALKDAGIDDIIAENQRQLDEWLAAQ